MTIQVYNGKPFLQTLEKTVPLTKLERPKQVTRIILLKRNLYEVGRHADGQLFLEREMKYEEFIKLYYSDLMRTIYCGKFYF